MENEQRYTTGFNNGYLLAKCQPDLLAKIMQNIPIHLPYVQGLTGGKNEFEQEKMQEQIHELRSLRERFHAKDQEREP